MTSPGLGPPIRKAVEAVLSCLPKTEKVAKGYAIVQSKAGDKLPAVEEHFSPSALALYDKERAFRARVHAIQSTLGIETARVEGGNTALIKPTGRFSGGWRAAAVYRKPHSVESFFLAGVPWFTMFIRSVPVPLGPILEQLSPARTNEQLTAQVLQALSEWTVPPALREGIRPFTSKELVIWAPAGFGIPESGQDAVGDTRTVDFARLPSLVWDTMLGRNLNGTQPNPDFVLFAGAPEAISFSHNFYTLGEKHFAIWRVLPRSVEAFANAIDALPVDLLVHVERDTSSRSWATILVRFGSTDPKALDNIGAELAKVAKTKQIRVWEEDGFGLREALQTFVPGGPAPLPWNTAPIEGIEVLDLFTALPRDPSDLSGNMCLGHKSGWPVLVRQDEMTSVVLVGESGTGKSTMAQTLAAQHAAEHVVTVIYSQNPERIHDYVKATSTGQPIRFDLPGASNAHELERLIAQDKREIAIYWANLKKEWRKYGRPIGLPAVLQASQGSCPTRFAAYANEWLKQLLAAWDELFKGQPLSIIHDDVSAAPAVPTTQYGQLSERVGTDLRNQIKVQIVSGRKLGLMTIVIEHSAESFNSWPSGSWDSIAFGIRLELGSGFKKAIGFIPTARPGVPFATRGEFEFSPDIPEKIVELFGTSSSLIKR